MLKTVLAIVVAASCAAAIAAFVPAPSPAEAAGTRVAESGNAGCARPWPYYESACLRESRQRSSNSHAVRIITLASQGAPRMPHTRR